MTPGITFMSPLRLDAALSLRAAVSSFAGAAGAAASQGQLADSSVLGTDWASQRLDPLHADVV